MTIDSGQGWAYIIGALFQGLVLGYTAWAANRARKNSGDVKQAIGPPPDPNAPVPQPTLQQQVSEIHAKADTAIAQNVQLEKNTDGHFSEVLAEMRDWKLEAERLRAENKILKDQQAKAPPAVIIAADPPRQARGDVPGRRAEDLKPK